MAIKAIEQESTKSKSRYFIGIIGIGAGQKELDLIMFALCSVLHFFRQKKIMVARYKWWYCFSVGILEDCFSIRAKRRAVSDWRIGRLIGLWGTRPDKFHTKSDFKWNITTNMARTIKLEFIHCYFFSINFIEVQISCHLTPHFAFSIRLDSAFSLPYLVIAVLLCILNQTDFGNLTPISISFISSAYSSGS